MLLGRGRLSGSAKYYLCRRCLRRLPATLRQLRPSDVPADLADLSVITMLLKPSLLKSSLVSAVGSQVKQSLPAFVFGSNAQNDIFLRMAKPPVQ